MNWTILLASLSALSLVLSLASIFFLFKARRVFKFLVAAPDKKTLDQVLIDLDLHLIDSKRELDDIASEIKSHNLQSLKHIQKVGLVRFNPFPDTGGDQSFSLAILDGHDDGFVISSLHGRDYTRIFAKPVKNGKGEKFELSQEEQLAITKAVKLK